MKPSVAQVALRKLADPLVAEQSQRFCKTAKGEYGEHYVFLGVRVPQIRATAKQHKDLSLNSILDILYSKYHEERLLALIMMVQQFEKGSDKHRQDIYDAYLANTQFIDGWDLVDSSAHQIVGGFLFERSRRKLVTLAKSKLLWERRIAIIATYHFIKRDQYTDTLTIAKHLLKDDEDLIHKAVGWMLREVGNRDKQIEAGFLKQHYQNMPRTMLRYAIEKFDKHERDAYLSGEI